MTQQDIVVAVTVSTFVLALLTGTIMVFNAEIRDWLRWHLVRQPATPTHAAKNWVGPAAVVCVGLFAISILAGIVAVMYGRRLKAGETRSEGAAGTQGGVPPPTQTAPTASGTVVTVTPPETTEAMLGGIRAYTIPAGSGIVGCAKEEEGCARGSKVMDFDRPFLMTATEVTIGDFQRCVTAHGCANADDVPRNMSGNVLLPVVMVDAAEAQEFCRWIGGRLPTEEEWEYAARSGQDDWIYPWGRALSDGPTSATNGSEGGRSPVNVSVANPWGVAGLAGNVAEWCTSTHGQAPIVAKGGWYASSTSELRISAREPSNWHRVSERIGFRCVGPAR